ncbi:MAG TPA: DMT family transporter [Massilibacterium sp.]|nr:DMT family transporter [Massilibacterium sp.]
MNRLTVLFLLVTATALWGGNFVIGRSFVNTLPPFALALFRWIVAFFTLLPFGLKELKNNRKIWKEHRIALLFMALTGIAMFNTLVYIAVHYTTSINASLINSSTPIMIMILSVIFLREKLSWKQGIGIILSLIGVLFIISRGEWSQILSLTFNKGEMWMLLAVTTWAIYSILVKKFGGIFPQYGSFLYTIIVGIIMLIPFASYEYIKGATYIWNLHSVLGVLYVGIFASIVAFLCWNKAVIHIGPGKAAPFLNLIPVFATVFAILFLNEQLMLTQVIGGALVIVGVFISSFLK